MNIADKEKRKRESIWGQSSAISEEDAGCRRDGHRLNEGTTTPPHETPALIGSSAPDAEPRKIVDPVDDQRHLIETLISLGVEQGVALKKVIEVYSPPRVTKAARQRADLNIEGPIALDLSTSHPGRRKLGFQHQGSS